MAKKNTTETTTETVPATEGTRVRRELSEEEKAAKKEASLAKVQAARDHESKIARIGVASASGKLAGIIQATDDKKFPTVLLRTTHESLARMPVGAVVALEIIEDPFAAPAPKGGHEVTPAQAAAATANASLPEAAEPFDGEPSHS